MLTNLIQRIIDGMANLGSAVDRLPVSPFQSIEQLAIDHQILSFAAWLIPFPQIIALLQAWIAAIAVWYVAKTALRWAKIIQ